MSELDLTEISVKRQVQDNCHVVGNIESKNLSALGTKLSERESAFIMARPRPSPTVTLGSSPRPTTETLYYGINIPCENPDNLLGQDFPLVYTDKMEALSVLKLHKKARFKVFKTRQEALEFACQNLLDMPSAITETSESKLRPNHQAVGEKPSLFKGPKAQDLVKLRKSIECGDLNTVHIMVWENPRYLVSSGDTPAILQEGSRYNALHVAAKAKNAAITDRILQTVGNSAFVGLLYGDDNSVQTDDRIRILLDLYLNTPDKGLNETPLHFAVKYGASKVVEVLISCPQCEIQPKNKYGQTPKDIVCSRVNSPDAGLKEEILSLLDGRFYVPVLRSGDNTIQPSVGKPFSPVTCLPELNENPLDTCVQIRAYAGPMSQEQAAVFHKKWKTPPRIKRAPLNPWRLADSEKGLEREGRDLAQELKVGWKEYWAFLDTFVDFSSNEGLNMLEHYLQKRFFPGISNYENDETGDAIDKIDITRNNSITTSNNSFICDKISKCSQSPVSPITDLCLSLQACTLTNASPECNPKYVRKNIINCRVTQQKEDTNGVINQEEAYLGVLTNPGLSPFLYVDKSCQVFGKRIADGLTQIAIGEPGSSGDSILDFLRQEMKHLQVLVCSYKNDARFVSVDFHFVHSRIASIVRINLTNRSPEEMDAICDLSLCVDESQNIHMSSDDEDLNLNPNLYRTPSGVEKKKKSDAEMTRTHVKCISHHIFNNFRSSVESIQGNKVHYRTEEDCMKVWADAVKCCCPWPVQNFVRNRRNRNSIKKYFEFFTHSASSQEKGDSGEQEDTHSGFEGVTSTFNDAYTEGNKLSVVSANEAEGNPEQVCEDSEEEEFFSAPSSPLPLSTESSEDEMESPDEGEGVFIEGNVPSQVDISVLQALDNINISSSEHPNIYRWRHALLLHVQDNKGLAHYPTTPDFRHKPRLPTHSFSLHGSWHNVVPPSSPLSPQFNREARKKY